MNRTALLHRRLAVGMGLAGLVAFAGGAGFQPVSALLSAATLTVALFWQPSPALSAKLERVWLPLAVILVVRAVIHFTLLGGDVVIPVVDLLLLLLCAEALRSLDAPNDVRLYALSLALVLASTAYRPSVVFAVAFAAYLVLGTMALTVGHLRRQAIRFDVPPPKLRSSFLIWTGSLSLVVFAVAGAVFLTFPRTTNAWAGRGRSPARSIVGFSDVVSLGEHGATIEPNPEIVLRVEFPDGAPADPSRLLWRGRSYDRFDGVRWTRSRQTRAPVPLADWHRRWGDSLVVHTVFGSRLDVPVLFALHPVVDQDARSRIQPVFDQWGDLAYWGGDTPIHTATSVATRPHPDSLRAVGLDVRGSQQAYLQLPELSPDVRLLADSVTAGRTTTYDRARAIEEWLKSFQYTMNLPRTAREATLEHFLFERRAGHCEYFSTAMVVLLRSLGIPSRNVNGFAGGQWSDFGEYIAVSQNEAHSWVEVWFSGYGWVPFDPTPAGGSDARFGRVASWPGRFLFDALQHRWGKWILDYSLGAQSDLLDRLVGRSSGGEGSPSRPSLGSPLVWLLLLSAGVLTWLALQRGKRSRPRAIESRLYVKLLASCGRADLVPRGGVGPLELVERLRTVHHPATGPAAAFVRSYVESRFGGRELDDEELGEMRTALALARRLLRRGGGDAGSGHTKGAS